MGDDHGRHRRRPDRALSAGPASSSRLPRRDQRSRRSPSLSSSAPPWRAGSPPGPVAFLVAGGIVTLAFEVLMTRLFSARALVPLRFHGHLSIALLGQGAGAAS
ncbi:MAG: hypothetical protein U0166_23855 [Acidobacteriota bacterium]